MSTERTSPEEFNAILACIENLLWHDIGWAVVQKTWGMAWDHVTNCFGQFQVLTVSHSKSTVPHPNPEVYLPAIKFWNIEESVLRAVQLAQDDSEGKDAMDVESNSELEGILDAHLPLHSITFEIDWSWPPYSIQVLYGYQPSHLYTVYGTSAGTNGTVTVDLMAVRRVLWGYGMIECVKNIQICASLLY